MSLRDDLTAKGLQFNDVDRATFRDALGKTTYYKDWHARYGEEAWGNLEKYAGQFGVNGDETRQHRRGDGGRRLAGRTTALDGTD